MVEQWFPAEATLSGGSTTLQNNIPSGAVPLWYLWVVKTDITFDGSGSSCSAAFTGGLTDTLCTGQAPDKNTKGDEPYFATAKASSDVDILVTPNTGTFTGGELVFVVRARLGLPLDDYA